VKHLVSAVASVLNKAHDNIRLWQQPQSCLQAQRFILTMDFSDIDVELAFSNFVEEYGGVVSDRDPNKTNKAVNADYIFHEAQVVAELKILKEDPYANKEFRKSHAKKEQEWIDKGYITNAELNKIARLRELPDRCYRDIEKLYIRPLKTHVEKANQQIKSTKKQLGLPDYKGLLFLVSDGNFLLDPKNIRLALGGLFASGRYSGINTVLYLTVNVVTTRPDDRTLSRLWTMFWREGQLEQVSLKFLNDLYDKWFSYFAELTGIPIYKVVEVNEQGITEVDVLKETEFVRPMKSPPIKGQ